MRDVRRIVMFQCGLVAVWSLIAPWAIIRPSVRKVQISQDGCALIHPGMTHASVERIVGGPAGDYSTRGAFYIDAIAWSAPVVRRWVGDQGVICVGFDAKDTVLWTVFITPTCEPSDGLLDGLRRWISAR
jgi:hypothetical protein